MAILLGLCRTARAWCWGQTLPWQGFLIKLQMNGLLVEEVRGSLCNHLKGLNSDEGGDSIPLTPVKTWKWLAGGVTLGITECKSRQTF